MTTVPDYALGSNGKPAVMVAPTPAASAEFALPKSDGNVVRGLPVFKAGKVKDSTGRQHDWTVADLDLCVENFKALRESGRFPNVPVRANHGRDVKEVGGYYLDVRREGDKLLADIEFTEPDMKAKYDRGTYRSRSIELGAYESNDGEIVFPAVMGLAFCDIPAVEGLFSASVSAYEKESDREVILFAQAPADAGGSGAAPQGAEDESAEDAAEKAHLAAVLIALHALAGKVSANPDAHAAVLQVIAAIQAMQTDESSDPSASSEPAATKAATKAGAAVETFKFTVNGAEVDVAGDDSTKTLLAQFAASNATLADEVKTLKDEAETRRQEFRAAQVDAWRDGKKIVPAQVEGMKAYVKTLTDEQFIAHAALIDAAGVHALAEQHGGAGGEDASSTEAAKIDEYRQTYSMLKTAGLSPEKLAASKPAKALAAMNVPVEA